MCNKLLLCVALRTLTYQWDSQKHNITHSPSLRRFILHAVCKAPGLPYTLCNFSAPGLSEAAYLIAGCSAATAAG